MCYRSDAHTCPAGEKYQAQVLRSANRASPASMRSPSRISVPIAHTYKVVERQDMRTAWHATELQKYTAIAQSMTAAARYPISIHAVAIFPDVLTHRVRYHCPWPGQSRLRTGRAAGIALPSLLEQGQPHLQRSVASGSCSCVRRPSAELHMIRRLLSCGLTDTRRGSHRPGRTAEWLRQLNARVVHLPDTTDLPWSPTGRDYCLAKSKH